MKNAIVEQAGDFKRIIRFSMPFDKRHPDPNKSYGIHGMDNIYILEKDKKAVQFMICLPVYLDHVAEGLSHQKVLAADVGYHAPFQMSDDQSSMGECDIIGCECFYDGSGLHAEEVWKEWQDTGDWEWIWTKLEEIWNSYFPSEPIICTNVFSYIKHYIKYLISIR